MKPALRRWLLLSVVVALVGSAVAYQQQTQPDLLPLGARARRVVAFDSMPPHWWWLTENEVLLLRGTTSRDYAFSRHNIDTGAETPLAALTALHRASAGKPETLRVAPTGDWALWSVDRNDTYVASLDGRAHYRVREPGPRYNVWKFAGGGWYALHLDGGMIDLVTQHDLHDPGKAVGTTAIAAPFRNDPASVNLDQITPASPTRLLVPLWTGGKGKLDRANVIVTGFGARPTDFKTLRLPPPYLNFGGEVAFSPWSDQIAWRLDVHLPRARFWDDLGMGNSSQYSVGFWVTNQKTGRTFSYGYLDTDRRNPASAPTDLRFSPVGTYFSFVYRNALWVVATE